MSEMNPAQRVQALLDLKKQLDQAIKEAEAKLGEISNLTNIGGNNAASIARSVKASNTLLNDLKKVLSGQRGLGHKMDLWKANLEDMGFKVG